MYKYRKPNSTPIVLNISNEGETIELKVQRIMNNKEPIKDAASLIYTDRKDGVNAAYNIRTDRFELATDAMDRVHKSRIAKRDESIKNMTNVVNEVKDMKVNKVEPTDGKS